MTRRPLDSRPGRTVRNRPGVPAERTELTWERSAVGLLGAAGLLLFRHVEPLTTPRVVLFALYLAVAVVTVQIGRWRGRQVRRIQARDGAGAPVPSAPAAVFFLAAAALVVAGSTVAVVLLDA